MHTGKPIFSSTFFRSVLETIFLQRIFFKQILVHEFADQIGLLRRYIAKKSNIIRAAA